MLSYSFVCVYRRISSLIENCSAPNKAEWIELPGNEKGIFQTRVEADQYLESLIGSNPTDSETERADRISRKSFKLIQMKRADTANLMDSNSDDNRRFEVDNSDNESKKLVLL